MNSKQFVTLGLALFLTMVAPEAASEENEKRRYSEGIYKLAFEKTSCSSYFKNMTLPQFKDFIDELSSWEAPTELQQKFPFYEAGYDNKGRPVWVLEFGKYNFKEEIMKGPEATSNLEKYMYQSAIRFFEVSILDHEKATESIHLGVAIVDDEGFNFNQLSHGPTFRFLANEIQTFSCLASVGLEKVFVINEGISPQFIENYGHILFGSFMKLVEVHGKRSKWEPILQNLIPEKSLPPWYGGSKDFKPVRVFG